MSSLVMAIQPTSAFGPMRDAQFLSKLIRASGDLFEPGTSSSRMPTEGERIIANEQTTSGQKAPDILPTVPAVLELRRLTGLTWDQLARLFGVDRRSLHFWASGKQLSKTNEELLGRILAVVRRIDSGSAAVNRTILLGASEGGVVPFDLLIEGRFDEVLKVIGTTPQVARPRPKPLSKQARMARAPRRPQDLVGANQEVVHKEIGKARRPRVARVKKRDV